MPGARLAQNRRTAERRRSPGPGAAREGFGPETRAADIQQNEHPALGRSSSAIGRLCKDAREQNGAVAVGLAERGYLGEAFSRAGITPLLDEGRAG